MNNCQSANRAKTKNRLSQFLPASLLLSWTLVTSLYNGILLLKCYKISFVRQQKGPPNIRIHLSFEVGLGKLLLNSPSQTL